MSPLLWKGIAGFTVSSVVAGAIGFSVTRASEKETVSIKTLLTKNRPDKRLLFAARKATDPDWRAAWKRYVSRYSGSKENPFSVTEFVGEDAPSNFMSKCESLFEEKVVDNEDEKYELALEFCTRNTLVSDFVWAKGKQALSEQNGYSK